MAKNRWRQYPFRFASLMVNMINRHVLASVHWVAVPTGCRVRKSASIVVNARLPNDIACRILLPPLITSHDIFETGFCKSSTALIPSLGMAFAQKRGNKPRFFCLTLRDPGRFPRRGLENIVRKPRSRVLD